MVAQEVHTLTFRKKTEQIRSNIEVINAQAEADIAVINEEANAKGAMVEAGALAQAATSVLKNEARLYNTLGKGLGLLCTERDPNITDTASTCGAVNAPQNTQSLLQYLWISTYKDKNSKMVVGLNSV